MFSFLLFRIGWLDGDDLYLEPDAALSAAQRLARDAGDALVVTPRTLHRRLRERGYLASTDVKRETLKVRRTLEGARRDVLHLRAGSVMRGKPDQPDQAAGKPRAEGRFDWSGSRSGSDKFEEKPDQETRPDLPQKQADAPGRGRVGRVPGDRETDAGNPEPAMERFEI